MAFYLLFKNFDKSHFQNVFQCKRMYHTECIECKRKRVHT